MSNLIPAYPEFIIALTIGVLLMVDLWLPRGRKAPLMWLSLVGMAIASTMSFALLVDGTRGYAFTNMFVADPLANLLKLAVYVSVAASLIYGRRYLSDRELLSGEFFILSMFAMLTGDMPPLVLRSHGRANFFQQAAMVWRDLQVPVIAALHGVCFGGGLQIAAGADIRIAAPDTRLAVMELKWGIIPDMGHYTLWRGMVREDALRELTYTAREFSGEEAQALGFVTHLDVDPMARAFALAQEIAAKDTAAIRAAKALFNHVADLTRDEALVAESEVQDRLLAPKRSALKGG